MGKPAARLGDMTAHGGTVVVGIPNVLIGGMPAAQILSMHVCPMVTGVVPHVGGPVALASMGVMIGGLPAARMGDMAVCAGPPDTIILGCFTVLIGDMQPGGGGGGGGGAGGGSGSGGATGGAGALSEIGLCVAVYSTQPPDPKPGEGHWIEFQCVDTAGLPVGGPVFQFTGPDRKTDAGVIPDSGRLRREGIPAGSCMLKLMWVSGARWSKAAATTDEDLTLTADAEGFAEGTPARISICRRNIKGADREIAVIDTTVKRNRILERWNYVVIDDAPPSESDAAGGGYSNPVYYFSAQVGPCASTSPMLLFKDWVEVELRDDDGKAMANEEYRLVLSTGEVRTGKLDGSGKARIDGIPPGGYRVEFPAVPDIVFTG